MAVLVCATAKNITSTNEIVDLVLYSNQHLAGTSCWFGKFGLHHLSVVGGGGDGRSGGGRGDGNVIENPLLQRRFKR